MHTASQIWFGAFTVHADDGSVEPASLLDWQAPDRFGIVVREPFGALGAGLLISLAIAAFYDVPGRDRRKRDLYPEIYLFHVGQRWGDHSSFDFWPERKEMVVADDPAAVLQAINASGITHLAVPDGPLRPCRHVHREPDAARDRIRACFAYAAGGSVVDADLIVDTDDDGLLANYDYALQPELWLPQVEQAVVGKVPTTPDEFDLARVVAHTHERWNEVARDDPHYLAMRRRIADARSAGTMRESYRRIDVEAALQMLA